GQFPTYFVTIEGADGSVEQRFVATEKDLKATIEEVEQRVGHQIELTSEDDETAEQDKVTWLEIFSAPQLAKVFQQLEKYGVLNLNWTPVEEPFYFLKNGDKDRLPVDSLRGLLDTVRENGKKGLTIQRYKGLGEMNPEQLWETTMDPQHRKMVKVMLENIPDAEETFTILMGDEVEPRRAFIETNALNVKNLDI
ncbi:MAG: DNA gyrase subunit B, partial [Verrucomicrobiota bacterium]